MAGIVYGPGKPHQTGQTDKFFDGNVIAILRRCQIPQGRCRDDDLVNARRVVLKTMGALNITDMRRMWKITKDWVGFTSVTKEKTK